MLQSMIAESGNRLFDIVQWGLEVSYLERNSKLLPNSREDLNKKVILVPLQDSVVSRGSRACVELSFFCLFFCDLLQA